MFNSPCYRKKLNFQSGVRFSWLIGFLQSDTKDTVDLVVGRYNCKRHKVYSAPSIVKIKYEIVKMLAMHNISS